MTEKHTIDPQTMKKQLEQRARQAVIHNKAKRPVFAPHFWPRSELLTKAFQQQDIVWLNCAAGYGKTLLMAEYCDQQSHVIWFRCDDRDASATAFLDNLLEVCAAQLMEIENLALSHRQLSAAQQSGTLQSGTQHPSTAVDADQSLLLWLDEIAAYQQPVVLCLDDVHLLKSDDVQSLLARLISERPNNLKLLLAGRYLPQSLGRLRLQQNIVWLSSQELTFNDDQVQRFLMNNDVEQAGRLVPVIHSRLQGWPAGLSLWLGCFRALGKPSEPPVLLGQLEMSDYLQGEALHALSTDMQQFIQQAAVVGTFNESLLEHCLGSHNFHGLLQQALSQNLFIEPLSDRPGWYAFHPVMASLLSQQLPQASRQSLHAQAYDWLRRGNDRMAALFHAKEAGLSQQVIPWVEEQVDHLIGSLDIAAMLEWLEGLGDELLRRSSHLMMIAAWSWLFTQQRDKALPLVNTLIQSEQISEYEKAALQGYLARLDGDIKHAEERCKFALEHLPEDRFTIRILMGTSLSLLCLVNNDADGARIWNRFAQDLARQHQVPAMEAQVLFDYGRIELNRGHIKRSLTVIEQGLTLLTANKNSGISLGRLLSYKAFMLWLMGHDRKPLIDMMQQGISASSRSHDTAVCYGYAFLAMAKAEVGQYDEALDLLDQVERLMQRWQVRIENYQWLAMVKANVWIYQGKLTRAQSYIDEFIKMQENGPLVRSDVFPMLPDFISVTRARLYLKANNPKACIAEADQWLRNNSQNLMSVVIMMLRAVALRAEKPAEGEAQLRHLQTILDREGIGMDMSKWIPNLHTNWSEDVELLTKVPDNVSLSERELEVLRKIDQGLSNQEIADLLFISLHTVKTHARKINVKLGAKSRTQALHRAKELLLI